MINVNADFKFSSIQKDDNKEETSFYEFQTYLRKQVLPNFDFSEDGIISGGELRQYNEFVVKLGGLTSDKPINFYIGDKGDGFDPYIDLAWASAGGTFYHQDVEGGPGGRSPDKITKDAARKHGWIKVD